MITVKDLQKAIQESSKESSIFLAQIFGGDYMPSEGEVINVEKKKGFLSNSSHLSGLHIKVLFAIQKMAWSIAC